MSDTQTIDRDPNDRVSAREKILLWMWIIGGCVLGLVIALIAFELSRFCLCDRPPPGDPVFATKAGAITIGVWSALCGLGYLLRRWAIAIWIPIIPLVIVVSGMIFIAATAT